jgi:hypothetical protein
MRRLIQVANFSALTFLYGVFLITTSGCSTEGVVGGVGGATVFGAVSPTTDIEQVYYLGVFDPQEQIEPTVYRVRIRGQASALNAAKYGSGWVPAQLIDSLNTRIKFNKNTGRTEFSQGDEGTLSKLKTGRRLMMFGPEGFREAPANHRLVIVMGANPEAFFSAVDNVLGSVSQGQRDQRNSQLNKHLFEALLKTDTEIQRLGDLEKSIESKKISDSQN